ncbi:hypothetical protein [Nocardia harenae]|uniref:hypothetical protein n=1 Tax=Nocardia harenae TaxID=358707 RepID=UPI00082F3D36|nr:hypothetical protein [Nocardia harenae]
MTRRGPLLTLAAAAVLGLALLGVNMSKEDPAPAAATSPAASVVAPATSATPAAAPTPAPPTGAPASAPFPAKADYVGTITRAAGPPLTLAITVEDGAVTAYACDGAAVETWLQGRVVDDVARLDGRNGARLEGRAGGGAVRGTLWIGDKSWEFTAPVVTGKAGLYAATDGGVRQSWIVDGAGGVTGVRRGADGGTAPAGPLPATATRIGGGDSVG